MEASRYLKNHNAISKSEQGLLAQKRVAIIGCGGLGGYLVEQLGRLGVGFLRVVDPDIFEETNLNRQLLSSSINLGKPKVLAAKQRLQAINPLIRTDAIQTAFTKENAPALLADSDLVLDALDNIPDRLLLQQACENARLPLIHGAVAGWQGQVCVIQPGENLLSLIYGETEAVTGEEADLGTLAFTVGFTASLMAAEATKVLLGKALATRQLISIDGLSREFHIFKL